MAENNSATPDLQSILATLAQYAPPPRSSENVSEQFENPETPLISGNTMKSDVLVHDSTPTEHTQLQAKDPRLRPQSRSATASPRPMIDPATITTWQDGLRCVTKIAAANDQFAVAIKRMMKDQLDKERRWYTERQNLKLTQANRSASAAKARSILKSLNTNFSGESGETGESEASKDAELAQLDRKIYSAQVSMEAVMTAELKSLGVPFFGTDEKLIVKEHSDVLKEPLPEGQPRWSPFVTETQLLEMRRKMLGHLEDLYRD